MKTNPTPLSQHFLLFKSPLFSIKLLPR